MNKLNKILIGCIAILALIIYPVIVYPNDQSHKDGFLSFLLRIIGDLLILFLLSLLISAILSLIPLTKETYQNKIKKILLPITLIVLIANSLTLLLHETIKFDEIKIASSLDCKNLSQGDFICKYLEIKRTSNMQIEFDSRSNSTKEYQVKWITDCQYELIGINGNIQNYRVKIVEVNVGNHKAYVSRIDQNNAQLIVMKNK